MQLKGRSVPDGRVGRRKMQHAHRDQGVSPRLPCAAPEAVAPDLPPVLEVLEHTSDCVVLLDENWRFTYLNSNARAVLQGGDALIGEQLHNVFVSERGTAEWKQTQAAAKARQSTRFEFFASHLKIWFEVDLHPMPSGLQIYFRDVTERRNTQQTLAAREEALRRALEAVGDAAWDWDLRSGHLELIGQHAKALGYELGRFDGSIKTLNALMHRDDVESVSTELTKHLAGRTRFFAAKFRVRASNGEWHWIMTRGRVIERDPITNWASRMVGTSLDIHKLSLAAKPPRLRQKARAVAPGEQVRSGAVSAG